ncbi:MAG: aldehyde dehydrogenase family protein, partial [Pseudomonadales bacterium]|nr:aldehyde dehydrogenase family protein [Pseudomonadales bacterium]
MRNFYPLYVGGEPESTPLDIMVLDVYSGQVAAKVARADADITERAIIAACAAASVMAALPRFRRQEILRYCVREFQVRAEELAQILCVEAGKPLRDARVEVDRLIETFAHAADCCIESGGEMLSLDVTPRGLGYRGMVKRVPVGPVLLIAPFNFPLNLVAHKVAPAIAAGCPFILKPASLTPISALVMAEILAGSGLPLGAFSVLPCDRDVAENLVTDQRLRLLSFTGSAAVGWAIKARAGKKKVILELGGNAACIVSASADLIQVVPRLLQGVYAQAGQSCISV